MYIKSCQIYHGNQFYKISLPQGDGKRYVIYVWKKNP